jgi:MFS family permease
MAETMITEADRPLPRAPLPRNFARLVGASGLSNLADGVFQVVLPLVALGITRDPAAFASVTVVGRLPWLLFALPAGALADRLDRRRTMLLVNLGRAALIGGLAAVVAGGWEELWVLYVVAFALGVGETMFDTAAQSILPNIVTDPDALSRANGRLYAVELTANQFVGPPLGGLLAGVLAVALAASAGAYLLAAAALALLVGAFRPARTGPKTRLRTDVAEGLRYLVRHRVLRTLAICVGLSNLANTAMFAVFPLFAVAPGPMRLSERGFGLLLTSAAFGSLAGSAIVARVEAALGRWGALMLSAVLFPIALVVPAITASAWAVAAGLIVTGVAGVVWNVITVTLRQRTVPDHLLGRVNSAYRLLAWGSMPLGAFAGGFLAEAVGLRWTFAAAAAVNFLCMPLLLANITGANLVDSEVAPAAT